MLSTDFETALRHLREGRAADAFNLLSRIVDRWPTYAAAQVAYAQALEQLGQPEASFQAWSRAEALVSHSAVVAAGLQTSAALMFAPDEVAPAALDTGDSEPVEDRHGPVEDPADDQIVIDQSDIDEVVAEGAEFSDVTDTDPVSFIPIAVPFDEADDTDAGEAEWIDGPVPARDDDTTPDHAEWDGGYSGEAGDGVDSDVELDAPPEEADLDRLIDELQTARIVPADDPSSIPPPDLSDDIDDVVSETLASIYATQNQYAEAARVYERLALENPDRAAEYRSKASEMRARDR